jgi:hypothetical protein
MPLPFTKQREWLCVEREVMVISSIELEWSDWSAWEDIKADERRKNVTVRVPKEPGVYEAKYKDAEERLTIGRATNLRQRVKEELVRGNYPHDAGDNIRLKETVADVIVRWAITSRPAATEEELHQRHRQRFGKLPK